MRELLRQPDGLRRRPRVLPLRARQRELRLRPAAALDADDADVLQTFPERRLVESDAWFFIGYSLPSDDVHVRTLLLKAWHTRRDRGYAPPRVTIVTAGVDHAMLARYAGLFRRTCVDDRGFARFLGDLERG